MSDTGTAAGPRRIGAVPAMARVLMAVLCLLAAFGSASPVFCLEGDGDCAGSPAAPQPEGCHERPGDVAGCASCTDVAAPEESLARTSRPALDPEAAAAAPIAPLALIAPPRPAAATLTPRASLPGPTAQLLRSTVLLI